MIRLLVVDDHPVVTAGLAAELANEPDMEVVASAGTVEDAIRLIEQTVPDVVIADVLFELVPEASGLSIAMAGIYARRSCSSPTTRRRRRSGPPGNTAQPGT